jgi:hypothetical protein
MVPLSPVRCILPPSLSGALTCVNDQEVRWLGLAGWPIRPHDVLQP